MNNKLTDLEKLELYYTYYKQEYVKCFDNILFKIFELKQITKDMTITDETAFNTASIYANDILRECLYRIDIKDQELFGILVEN